MVWSLLVLMLMGILLNISNDAILSVENEGILELPLTIPLGQGWNIISYPAQNQNDIEVVLSSETAGAYKPHPSVYELPIRMLDVNADEVLHVAGSGNDVLGARAYGIACYWSNRSSDSMLDTRYAPNHQGNNLRGVLDFLPAL